MDLPVKVTPINRRPGTSRRALALILICVAVLVNSACTREKIQGGSKILLPWPSESGGYSLQVVELNTLRDRYSLKGEAAQIFVEPALDGKTLKGVPPTARFIETNEGVLVPSDFLTSQMAGIYAHAEKLWDLDKALSIDGYIARPRRYGIQARAYADIETLDQIKNNASYLPEFDGTIIMPYEGDDNPAEKQLPISLNAGILAHEHFHAVFNAFVGTEDPTQGKLKLKNFPVPLGADVIGPEVVLPSGALKGVDLFNALAVRGFNEGLADLWGWIYSGDQDFISHSLPKLQWARLVKSAEQPMVLSNEAFRIRIQSVPQNLRMAMSYELGTSLARQIRRAAGAGAGDRLKLARTIIDVLPLLREEIHRSQSAQREIDVNSPVSIFQKALRP